MALHRQIIGRILALLGVMGAHPAAAVTAIVPDAFPTVQSAIDSGADSVLVREGTYTERVVVDHPVVLRGIGAGKRPRLSGLSSVNSYFWGTPPLLDVSRMDFTGPVEHATIYYRPRNLQFSFTECSLDSGFCQVLALDSEDVSSLTIRNCRLGAVSYCLAARVTMEADTVEGGVSWGTHDSPGITIRDCAFRGATGTAIELSDTPRGDVTRNLIEGYDIGIVARDMNQLTLWNNTIIGAGTGVLLQAGLASITGNSIRQCGVGVDAKIMDYLPLVGNTIWGMGTVGIRTLDVHSLLLERNVVGGCGGSGIVAEWAYEGYVSTVRKNSVVRNGGSGIELIRAPYPPSVEGNVVYGNKSWGLVVDGGSQAELRCNDWFDNGSGAVNGASRGLTDLEVDPLFCDLDSADVRLNSASLLVDAGGCGQIGALGVGCGETATLVQRFTATRVDEGIRAVWQVAEGATAAEVWLERSEGLEGQAWIRPLTERSIENGAVVELDRAAAPEQAYRYRLVALEGSETVVIGPPILVEAQPRLEFRLAEVGPSPGDGPVRIAFTLQRAATIEVDVFDVQGRSVTSLACGTWPAGTHELEWDGRTRGGNPAPAGVYVVRYAYPGGQDRRPIVRVR